MQFNQFKQVFQSNFNKLIEGQVQLYVTDVDKQQLWDAYLNAFPDAERQGFNCNCCKSFIRNYGNVVAIKDGVVKSLWDFTVDDVMYAGVIAALNNLVCESNITNVFVTKQSKLGTDKSLTLSTEWQHLYYQLSQSFVTRSSDSEDTIRADKRSRKETFKRGLDELTIDATETVLDLIIQNQLYRGESNKFTLTQFLKHQQEYTLVDNKDNYCWNNCGVNVTGIRNTSIGSLLIDLSNGVDINIAVRKYEAMVAPSNYMRTNQVISSKKQVEDANKLVVELGLESALNRRFANESDINVNDCLFINRSQKLNTNVFDSILDEVPVNPKSLTKLTEVSIDEFIDAVLPGVSNVELLMQPQLSGNLVSLITAVDSAAPSLFKWNNSFSWVYNGGNADSMRERVKAAGGRVDNVVSRFSIQWNDNGDNSIDFDAHCIEPDGNEIAYHNKHSRTTGGSLDVDIITPGRDVAVENIVHIDRCRMSDGNYEYFVHNYSSRTSNGGFTAELEINNQLFSYVYDKNLRGGERVPVVTVKFDKLTGFTIVKSLDSSGSVTSSKEIWGIKTNLFHKVNLISLSPNHWTNSVGEKHYLFMIEGCINSDNPRSIFNEYLKSELVQHSRKVFDVLGDKLKTPSCSNQLSGVGFNSTLRNEFIVRVNGTRTMRVKV
jgi:hypothetical protein